MERPQDFNQRDRRLEPDHYTAFESSTNEEAERLALFDDERELEDKKMNIQDLLHIEERLRSAQGYLNTLPEGTEVECFIDGERKKLSQKDAVIWLEKHVDIKDISDPRFKAAKEFAIISK